MPESAKTTPAAPADSAQSKSSKRRTWRRRLLAVLFGFTFALVLAEIALRVIGYSSPVFLRPHPVYGGAFKPGIEGWFRLEGKAWNKINSHGFNGPEWSTQKPANTFRIVVLGDSFTAAQQVEQQDSFCQRLRQELQASGKLGKLQVEVLNCGCNGYGTAQHLLLWREQARHFQADLVLLAFLPGNDVNDNYRPLSIESRMRPYFDVSANGQLELDERFLMQDEYVSRQNWQSKVKYFFVEHSRLAQLANTLRLIYTARPPLAEEEKPAAPAAAVAPMATEIGLSDQAYQTPRGEWIVAWDITRRLIRQLQQEVLATNTKFGVVCLTIGAQTHPDPKARADFAKLLDMPDVLEPERFLGELCKTSQPPIPLLTLAPEFQKIATEQQVSMHGFGANLNGGHWNENGHRFAAKLIAEWLEANPKLLEPAETPQK
jgi:lysophospholipase L1-like esterase